jgi:putative transposase
MDEVALAVQQAVHRIREVAADLSPNLNAHAERFVRTIKESCLERMILFGEGAVRKATSEFMARYHSERNHLGLDNALICPEPEHAGAEGEVQRRERLGGLLNYYYRKAP